MHSNGLLKTCLLLAINSLTIICLAISCECIPVVSNIQYPIVNNKPIYFWASSSVEFFCDPITIFIFQKIIGKIIKQKQTLIEVEQDEANICCHLQYFILFQHYYTIISHYFIFCPDRCHALIIIININLAFTMWQVLCIYVSFPFSFYQNWMR